MNKINIQFYKSNYAEFILGAFEQQLCLLDFRYRKMRTTVDRRIQRGLAAEYVEKEDDTIAQAISQLDAYFMAERREFDLPLLMVGTAFQRQVWQALIDIRYGETSSYLQLAKNIGKEKAVRAVASANGANAMAIVIPCHRIIGSKGDLTGYGGGLALKKRLLDLEHNLFSQ